MPLQDKKERRFLVTGIDPAVLEKGGSECQWQGVYQGYWEPSPTDVMMIRRTYRPEGSVYTLIRRFGTGALRREERHEFKGDQGGEFLYESCPYKLAKSRRLKDGWKIDVYPPPLSGLIIAEIEVEDPSAPVTLPPWIIEAQEVTDSLTNAHLARLWRDLESAGAAFAREHLPIARIPRIVLTGGPCSGKSSVMEEAVRRFGRDLHCVPEVATIVIGQVGVKPPVKRPLDYLGFQKAIARVQRIFEDASAGQARRDDKKALLLDRGLFDNAAYLPNGRVDLARMLGADLRHEAAQYDLVLVLATPPRDVYERHKADNPARSESYDEAWDLGRRIGQAWADHPGLVSVVGSNWDEKRQRALGHIEAFLQRLPSP